mmetsp:Transcript_14809/g.26629  ORF Transcript_14809/g.26629 Transcript_14809/m.26629 type:complete len:199 (+) Transcript_14809:15-611(+)
MCSVCCMFVRYKKYIKKNCIKTIPSFGLSESGALKAIEILQTPTSIPDIPRPSYDSVAVMDLGGVGSSESNRQGQAMHASTLATTLASEPEDTPEARRQFMKDSRRLMASVRTKHTEKSKNMGSKALEASVGAEKTSDSRSSPMAFNGQIVERFGAGNAAITSTSNDDDAATTNDSKSTAVAPKKRISRFKAARLGKR